LPGNICIDKKVNSKQAEVILEITPNG